MREFRILRRDGNSITKADIEWAIKFLKSKKIDAKEQPGPDDAVWRVLSFDSEADAHAAMELLRAPYFTVEELSKAVASYTANPKDWTPS